MFKLKKILNKHNNAPELEILNVAMDTNAVRENVYYLTQGELSTMIFDDVEPMYYVIYSDFDEFQYDRRTKCLRITPDMIFEVKCNGIPTIGDNFAMERIEESRSGFDTIKIVGSSEHSDGYVVDVTPYSKNGCVLVRFHCKQ